MISLFCKLQLVISLKQQYAALWNKPLIREWDSRKIVVNTVTASRKLDVHVPKLCASGSLNDVIYRYAISVLGAALRIWKRWGSIFINVQFFEKSPFCFCTFMRQVAIMLPRVARSTRYLGNATKFHSNRPSSYLVKAFQDVLHLFE